ncbi:unnamed protein product, partial [marine sediment metagenome]
CSFQENIFNALKNLDGLIVYSQSAQRYLKGFTNNCICTHHPIPKELVKLRSLQLSRSRKKHFGSMCLGVNSWFLDYTNFLTPIEVFNRIRGKDKSAQLKGEIIGIPKSRLLEVKELTRKISSGINVFSHITEDYYQRLSKYMLVLNLSPRALAGRTAAECAVIGTPIIGNIETSLQRLLWPDLSVNPFDITKITEITFKLLENDEYHEKERVKAWELLQKLYTEMPEFKNYLNSWLSKSYSLKYRKGIANRVILRKCEMDIQKLNRY